MPGSPIPFEIQSAIAKSHIAFLEVQFLEESTGYFARVRRLKALCLVSSVWKDEAQQLLFRTIENLVISHKSFDKLLSTLETHAHLRPYIKQVTGFSRRQQSLLDHLRLFPNLSFIQGLALSHILSPTSAAKGDRVRPRLASLAGTIEKTAPVLDGPSTFSKIRAWFDIDALQQCTFSFTSAHRFTNLYLFTNANLDRRLEPHLRDIPAAVKSVSLYGFESDDLAPSMRALGRCTGLTRLVLDPAKELSLQEANPLAIFPALCELSVRMVADDSLPLLLAASHGSLQKLAVGNANSCIGYDGIHKSHPVPIYLLVDGLCEGQRTRPARFPALKTVIIIDARLSFAPNGQRSMHGLRDTVRKLRAVGLDLEDQDGCPWQDEWFDEPEVQGCC